jgi:aminoglycoside phosphotransferase (APT) family kinase protein
MMRPLDSSTSVRPGEELAVAALEAYLLDHLPATHGPLVVEQFPSGFSNLTYLLRLGGREFVLRRPPFGANIKSAHDMGREFRVLTALQRARLRVPAPLLDCRDETVIGAPFYIMERLHGVILRASPPKGIELPPALMRRIATAAVESLCAIHAVDYGAAGLGDLGRPEGYVARQIAGWTQRFRTAQTDEQPAVDEIIRWLEVNQPGEAGAALLHNDYKYDNLILDPGDLTRIVAVLDWEMCTIGDPLMDLGTTLGYWIEATDPPELHGMFGLTTLPGNLTRREVVDRYQEISGRVVSNPLFYYLYGLFKIAVIIQQIYARFRRGHTQDPRFARLDTVVRACGERGRQALDLQRISL